MAKTSAAMTNREGITKEKTDVWSNEELAVLHGHLGTDAPSLTAFTHERPTDRHETIERVIAKETITDETLLIVTLGSLNPLHSTATIITEHGLHLEDDYLLQVSTQESNGAGMSFNVFNKSITSTSPLVFEVKDDGDVKLIFDIMSNGGEKTARGVALLSNIISRVGPHRTNLHGEVNMPLVAAESLEIVGRVTFCVLVVKPFTHRELAKMKQENDWSARQETVLVGHRGLGKNTSARSQLQLGENTIQSFLTAASVGAEYVEFDVQMTKDHVPVIYHDFLVSETGIDAPMHTLTLEQFMHLNSSPRQPRSNDHSFLKDDAAEHNQPSRRAQRSYSTSEVDKMDTLSMPARMKYSLNLKHYGFKSNTRGLHVQSPFTTLHEMLKVLPLHIGFNIEMKYPMLFEAGEYGMDTNATELNKFVDTVLELVYSHGAGRDIVFSSFHPDLCIMLKLKQPRYSVLFLTDAGTWPARDIRATSLQEAINFAKTWQLLGIVSNAKPFMQCPRLVRAVKDAGLVCVSYGTENNEPDKIRVQVEQGIDAVIVDKVLKIRKALDQMEKKKGLYGE